jgi:hypothetical protein
MILLIGNKPLKYLDYNYSKLLKSYEYTVYYKTLNKKYYHTVTIM